MRFIVFALAICLPLCANGAAPPAFTTLVQFTGNGGTASGAFPAGSLIASGSTLYGMTTDGGAIGVGTVFSVAVNGTNYQNLVTFTGTGGTAIGENPYGSLIASGGALYGMTGYGGASGDGNIFSVGADGTNYQNLVSFTGTGGTASGETPQGSLIAIGGTLYGMTFQGGANGGGNVFSVGMGGGGYQNLVSFTGAGGTVAGNRPEGSLIVSGGSLYGMTKLGGSVLSDGSIFSVGTDGTNYQNLVAFNSVGGTANGKYPYGSLIDSGSTFYGMTNEGGAGFGNVFSVGANGTNYRNLVSFTSTGGAASGKYPFGSLVLSGTTLYGMTYNGGAYGDGEIFSVGISGSAYQDLYDFTGGTDGSLPNGDLTLSGGTLFGMTAWGGNLSLNDGHGDGTVFALTLPTPTPEPGTLALACCGAAAVAAYRWRRRAPKGRRFTQRRATPW